jgi:hypothetical protein
MSCFLLFRGFKNLIAMRKFLHLVLLLMLVSAGSLSAQLVIDVSLADYDHIIYEPGEFFEDNQDLIFRSSTKLPRYQDLLKTKGLSFRNNIVNVINSDIVSDQSGGSISMYSSPVMSIEGDGTVCKINGYFQAENSESITSVLLWDGGRFIVGRDAFMDVINSGYFTRQLWVWSDGTGVFELEEGFVADRTLNGTTPQGVGSFRFNHCNVVTHSSESLPMGFRPNTQTGIAVVNSHFVFEETPGSVWTTQSNAQEYAGGVWIDASMTIETETDLEVSGVRTLSNYSVGGAYTNWGGVMMKPSTVVTKQGPARLVLSGDHGYDLDTRHVIQDGVLEYRSDPFTNDDNAGYSINYKSSLITTPNLNVDVQNGGEVFFNTSLSRIYSLNLSEQSVVRLGLLQKVNVDEVSFNGTLKVEIPAERMLFMGDIFQLFQAGSYSGTFSTIQLNTFNGAITWDTSKLYSQGTISVASGAVMTTGLDAPEMSAYQLYPLPAGQFLTIDCLHEQAEVFEVWDLSGQLVINGLFNCGEVIDIGHLSAGVYILKIMNEQEEVRMISKFMKQ